MSFTITLPELGEGVDSVDVVAVLVAIGDSIEEEQGLIEVETEKASVEVPSTAAGKITEVHVAVGDVLGEAAPIVTLEAAEGTVASDEAETQPAAEPESKEPAPREGVKDLESAKAQEDPKDAKPESEAELPPSPTPRRGMRTIPAAPTVRRFAREVGVDLTQVAGSGPGGRISIDDVKAHTRDLLPALNLKRIQGFAGQVSTSEKPFLFLMYMIFPGTLPVIPVQIQKLLYP